MNGATEIITQVDEIGRYGAAVFHVTKREFSDAGYESGDIVDLAIGGKNFTAPCGESYSDVDSHCLILLKIALDERMLLAVNNRAGFAGENGIRPGDPVVIRMREKGGYLKEYALRSVTMSGNREDYTSDEEFANFRNVLAGNIAERKLYRGFSPINPADSRNLFADRLLSETLVKTVINLDNEKECEREKYDGYQDTFYSRLTIIPVKMSFSPEESGFFDGLSSALSALSENPAPYYIHCRYSRDRTGLLCMILESLCHATLSEITEDYMLSYENIHHLERYSEKWNFQACQHVNEVLSRMTGIENIEQADAAAITDAIRSMLLLRCGLSQETLTRIEQNLCES